MKKKQIVIGCIGIFLLVLVGFGAFFLGKSKGEKAKEGAGSGHNGSIRGLSEGVKVHLV